MPAYTGDSKRGRSNYSRSKSKPRPVGRAIQRQAPKPVGRSIKRAGEREKVRQQRRRPAPVSQPGPMPDKERETVKRHKKTKGYKKAVKAARTARVRRERKEYLKRQQPGVFSDAERRKVERGQARVANELERIRSSRKKSAASRAMGKDIKGIKTGSVAGGTDAFKLFKVPFLVGKATVEDPEGVLEGNLKTAKDIVTGIPGTAAEIVSNPIEGTKQAVSDYAKDIGRRYGPVLEGDDDEFVERIKKEGFLQEGLDAAAVAAPGGRAVGVGLKSTKRGNKLMTKPRPKLRSSGGKAKEQAVSRNAFVAVGQRAKDKARVRVQARRHRKVKDGGTVDALVREAVERGEVAPIRLKRARRKQHREVARSKSRAVQGMKSEQVREVHKGAAKDLAKLNGRERLGIKYAQQLGIRNPEQARKVLGDRLERLKVEGKRPPMVLRKTNDEFRVIESILKDPGSVFTARLAQTIGRVQERQARTSEGDPTLDPKQQEFRAWQPVAIHYGMERGENESAEAFYSRVKERAKEDGITDPRYFPSQKRPMQRFSDYAVGGSRAARGDKAYTGALFRTGREDVTGQPLLDAMARNVKRKFNWTHVASTFDEHAFAWSRGKTLNQIKDELDERGIDPTSVGLWSPGKFRDNRTIHDKTEDDLDTGMGEDPGLEGMAKAVDDSGFVGEEIAGRASNDKGYVVVPRGVYDEIHADTRPSGALGRSIDVLKGKQSRILLGTLNLPWLQFQMASNALLTGLAKTGPIDLVKAQVWWKRLDPEVKKAVEPWVGVGPFQMDVQQTRMGAAANNRMVNAYRAWKQTPFARRASRLNPLDAMFRIDNAQNNAFRRAVLYSQVKRDAYRRMGQNSGKAFEVQGRLTNAFKLGPEKQIETLLKDRRSMERHAQYVNDWLGDYVTYTAKERRWLARNIIFYGFLRYSLTMALYTLPVKHPVVTAIAANLSQLQSEEVRTLLGGDELPFAFGKFYWEDDGTLKEVDLARMNPATNTLMETLTMDTGGNPAFLPRRLLNLLPPAYVTALDLAYGKSAFSGRPLKVKGETNYDANNRKDPLELEELGRIAAERGLRLFYPYRLAETLAFDGAPMGDDTLLWDQRPTEYKDEEIKRGIRETERYNEENVNLLNEVIPFVPRKSRDRATARSVRERNREAKGETKPKPKSYADEAREFLKNQDSGSYADEARKWLQENSGQ